MLFRSSYAVSACSCFCPDGNIWKDLINHDCASKAEAYEEYGDWLGWETDETGHAYVYSAEAVYVDGTPVLDPDTGYRMYYFYYRCAYCGAFYKIGEYGLPEPLTVDEWKYTDENEQEVSWTFGVESVGAGWVNAPVLDKDGKVETESDGSEKFEYVFATILYLDGESTDAFNACYDESNPIYDDDNYKYFTDWEDLYIVMVEDEEGNVTYYLHGTAIYNGPTGDPLNGQRFAYWLWYTDFCKRYNLSEQLNGKRSFLFEQPGGRKKTALKFI